MAQLLLDRKKLLKKEVLVIEKVDLGKDEFVYVRQMTGRERDHYDQSMIKEVRNEKGEIVSYNRTMEDFRAKLAVVTICDEKGVLLLQEEDVDLLSSNMSAARLEKIVNTAQTINKMSDDDKTAIVKNLEAAPDGSSNSGSVKN